VTEKTAIRNASPACTRFHGPYNPGYLEHFRGPWNDGGMGWPAALMFFAGEVVMLAEVLVSSEYVSVSARRNPTLAVMASHRRVD
jgi:hypothetical protein